MRKEEKIDGKSKKEKTRQNQKILEKIQKFSFFFF